MVWTGADGLSQIGAADVETGALLWSVVVDSANAHRFPSTGLGDRIAYLDGNSIQVVDGTSGVRQTAIDVPAIHIVDWMAGSQSGAWLAVVLHGDGCVDCSQRLVIVDAATGQVLRDFDGRDFAVQADNEPTFTFLAWRDDAVVVAVRTGNLRLSTWAFAAGASTTMQLDSVEGHLNPIWVSPGGSYLAVPSEPEIVCFDWFDIRIVDLSAPSHEAAYQTANDALRLVEWAPDDSRVLLEERHYPPEALRRPYPPGKGACDFEPVMEYNVVSVGGDVIAKDVDPSSVLKNWYGDRFAEMQCNSESDSSRENAVLLACSRAGEKVDGTLVVGSNHVVDAHRVRLLGFLP